MTSRSELNPADSYLPASQPQVLALARYTVLIGVLELYNPLTICDLYSSLERWSLSRICHTDSYRTRHHAAGNRSGT